MNQQNYSNHRRFVKGYHFISFLAIVILLIGAIRGSLRASEENLYSSTLLILVSLILLSLFFYLRVFALKAQDKAIRAEEKLRYFILTGKALSDKVTTRQIIGLRFASDEEFVKLANECVDRNLTEDEIKKEIKNWKEDNYRV